MVKMRQKQQWRNRSPLDVPRMVQKIAIDPKYAGLRFAILRAANGNQTLANQIWQRILTRPIPAPLYRQRPMDSPKKEMQSPTDPNSPQGILFAIQNGLGNLMFNQQVAETESLIQNSNNEPELKRSNTPKADHKLDLFVEVARQMLHPKPSLSSLELPSSGPSPTA